MPLYEYQCGGCGDLVELLVRGDEQPACPDCGSDHLEKLLSVPAAHTAGSSPAAAACETPMPGGNCGLPQCGTGGCQGLM